jgi:hypothetical protein
MSWVSCQMELPIDSINRQINIKGFGVVKGFQGAKSTLEAFLGVKKTVGA